MDKWIENLKVGDKVLCDDNLIEVTAIHKLHIVCGGSKFKKLNGQKVGSTGWYSSYIREATPERIAEIAEKEVRGKLLREIRDHNFRSGSTETLQKIVALLDAEKDGENG